MGTREPPAARVSCPSTSLLGQRARVHTRVHELVLVKQSERIVFHTGHTPEVPSLHHAMLLGAFVSGRCDTCLHASLPRSFVFL